MKVLHTSDWHLGKIIYEKSMIDDQRYFINETFFKVLAVEKPDLIIISGDIFDRQIASIDALRLFNEFLIKVCKEFKTPIAIISGNHDSPDRIAIASQILKDSNVYIVSNLRDENKIFSLSELDTKINVALLPYFDLQVAKDYLQDDEISLNEAYSKIVASLSKDLDDSAFNILVSHCFVTGTKNVKPEDALNVGALSEVSSKAFGKFDYVALGHIHSAQNVGENARYSGAPIKYSFDEPNKNKTMTLLNIHGKDCEIKEINITPRHCMRVIKGEFKEIIEDAKLSPSEDYICVELTDNMPIYMPMEQLRVYYPNILTMKTEWIKYANAQCVNTAAEQFASLNEKNEKAIFSQFLKEICDIEPQKEDYELFNEVNERLKKEDKL